MDSSRIHCIPLQQLQEPLAKPGHFEVLGRGLLQPPAGLTCGNALLADQEHLHIHPKGKLVVCKIKQVVAQNQSRASVIVANPQRQVCVEPQLFSPVKSEVNSLEYGAQTSHTNLAEDSAVYFVEKGGDDWYTPEPSHVVSKPCRIGSDKPPRAGVTPPTRDKHNSLEALNNTVKSRPSDFIQRSVLNLVESGIHSDPPPGEWHCGGKYPPGRFDIIILYRSQKCIKRSWSNVNPVWSSKSHSATIIRT